MKILLAVHQFFPEFMGGTEVLVLDTAKELQRNGHDVCVLTTYPDETLVEDNKRSDSYEYNGIHVERFRHSVKGTGEQSNTVELEYNNLFFASYFRNLLEKLKPDIVHFFHFHRLSTSTIDVCIELKIPTVYTATDFWLICVLCQLREYDNSTCKGPSKNAVNCIKHLAIAFQPSEIRTRVAKLPSWLLATGVLAIKAGAFSKYWFSPYVRAMTKRQSFNKKRMNQINKVLVPTNLMGKILNQNGLNKARIQFQQYGINLEPFNEIDFNRRNSEKLRIGFIGALYEHKGAHLLIEAICSLPENVALELKIYGNLNQSPEYSERLKSIAGEDIRIKFCGTFPNNEIGVILSEVDVLVVPSIWYENTPLVIYSAQAAKCPVIATNLGGMSEVIEDKVNGLLFEKGNVKELAKAINSLAEDRALLNKLANNAKEPKSISEYVSELECYYRKIVNNVEAK